mgnify:CR=1 FL=1
MSSQAIANSYSYRNVLTNNNFRLLWIGQLVSAFGDRLHQIALLVLVGNLTANNMEKVSLVWVSIGLPSLLLGLVAGALVDQWDRKKVLLVSDILRVPMAASIPWLASINISSIYIMALLITAVTLFFRPAKQAIIPSIVPEESLLAANSLSSITDNVADIIGYPVAGLVIAGLSVVSESSGIHLAFLIDAATYGFSAWMIAMMSTDDSISSGRKSSTSISWRKLLGDIVIGLKVAFQNPYIRTNTILVTLAALIGAGANTLSYGYAAVVTNTGGFGYSLLEGAIGFGSVLGGLLVGRWGYRVRKGPVILCGLIVMGISTGVLAIIGNIWVAMFMLALSGVGNMMMLVPSVTLVQEMCSKDVLGRIFSLRSMLLSLSIIIANWLAGIGAQKIGVQNMWGLLGIALMLIGMLGLLIKEAREAK